MRLLSPRLPLVRPAWLISGLLLLAGCVSSEPAGSSASAPIAPAPAPIDPAWIAGADVSALPVFEQHGVRFSADGRRADALQLLRAAGVDTFRLRLFVQPDGEGIVTNDLAYTLALARRARATGARLLLDIHYSDTWADPAKQFKPAAWAGLPFDQLVARVGRYTREVLQAFAAAGVSPDIVQIGNEITNGLLWPDGQVEFADAAGDAAAWARLAQLLRAGLDAVPTGPGAPQRLIHLESVGNLPRTRWFLGHLRDARLDYDLIGLSYYPEWHGTLADLSAALNLVAAETHKPVLVVETAYPWKNDEHWRDAGPKLAFPLTPDGQRQFLAAVCAAVRAVPGGLGRGVVYWHPESVPAPDLTVWLGGSCALFDDRGNLLPGARFGASPR